MVDKHWCYGVLAMLAAVLRPAGGRRRSLARARLPRRPQSRERRQAEASKGETHITPDQAKQLFALVDQLMQFSSQETGLPIKSTVKRQIRTRAEVEAYLNEKFNDDEDAKRLQKGEIVLKKFGLLDKDFDLKPFLLVLLKEQIEAYYDTKTKTVNMLDWVSVDEQEAGAGARVDARAAGPARGPGEVERSDARRCLHQLSRRPGPPGQG